MQPTASKHGTSSSSSSDEDAAAGGAGEPAAAAIGVFDGHGRLGGQAATIVRQASVWVLAAVVLSCWWAEVPLARVGGCTALLLFWLPRPCAQLSLH